MKKKILSVISLSFIVVMFLCNFTGSTSADETDFDFLGMTDEVAILVNEKRAAENLKPLKVAPILRDAATVRANESVVEFTHFRPGGKLFSAVLSDFSIFTLSSAENLAAGYGEPEEVVEQWMNSPGHRANIMNPNFTHIGVGLSYAPHGEYRWYWTQLFIKSSESFYNEYYPQRNYIQPVSTGDIGGEGNVSTSSAVLLAQALDGKVILSDSQLESADCLKDGGITRLDLEALNYFLLGKCDTLPLDFDSFWQAKMAGT